MTRKAATPRRFLIAAGTRRYRDPAISDLPGVDADVERVAELFAALGYTRVLAECGKDPTAHEFLSRFESWLADPDRRPDDIVVVYYAGHGVRAKGGYHYLLCADSRLDHLVSTAIKTNDLAMLLGDETLMCRSLILLDTCYAGAGVADVAALANQLAGARPRGATNLWMLAAARARDEASERAFTSALSAVLAGPRAGARQRFVDLSEVTERVNDHFRERHPHQHASCTAVDTAGMPPFFPNPNFVPGLSSVELDVETLQRMRRERAAHFDPRARGVEYVGEVGSYFTGRTAALAALTRWLAQPAHDRRARVVTGEPGSGKSALLGRLLDLADREHPPADAPPETVPPTGSVTTHLHLRRRNLDDVVAEVSRAAGCEAADLEELLVCLRDRSTTFTLLVDALDEAGVVGDQSEAMMIARELLRPMSSLPKVRLIVGTRRGPLPALGTAVEVIDLDRDPYVGPDDVTDYARALLLAADDPDSPSPYRGDPGLASTLAAGIAKRAGRCFLVANMTARALINGQIDVDVSKPDWSAQLPDEVSDVFASYLARFGENEWRVRRLLAPLAYAQGQGLPWDRVWAPMASALSGVECSDDDISWLFMHAGAYVVEVPVGGRSVFRLYHEALAEYLRDQRRDTEAHCRIMDALVGQAPSAGGRPRWELAHPYVLSHLASHAAICGRLETLLADPDFLVYANPQRLAPVLRHATGTFGRHLRSIYRSSLALHQQAEPEARRQILAFDAARYQDASLAERLSSGLAWRVRWATGSEAHPALQMSFAEPTHGVQGAASVVLDRQPCVVTAGADGTVRVWDIENGNLQGVLRGHTSEVNAVCCGRDGEKPIAVSASSDGAVRVWNLVSDEPGAVLSGHVGRVNAVALAEVGGELVAASGGDDRTIRLWNLASGRMVGRLTGHSRSVRTLAFATVDERAILLSGARDGTVRLWDPARGSGLATLSGHFGEVNAVVAAELDGAPIAVSGGDDQSVRVWDLRERRQLFVLAADAGWVRALAVAEVDGGPAVVVGTDDGRVQIWDLRRRAKLAVLLGHTHWVRAVTTLRSATRSAIVTGANDGTIRVWDPHDAVSLDAAPSHSGGVNAVGCAEVDGRTIVVSGGDDRSVRLWDVRAGERKGVIVGHTGFVRAVATAELAGAPAVVTAGADATVRVWDLRSRRQLAVMTGHTDWVGALACTTIRGHAVAVSGSDDSTARVWDLALGRERDRLVGHAGGINAVACATLRGRPVAVTGSSDGSLRLWDLETGRSTATFTGHTGWVRAVACTTLEGRPAAVSADDDGSVYVWDLTERRRLARLGGAAVGVNAVACLVRDGQTIAITGADDRQICLWNLNTQRREEAFTLPAPAWSLALSPRGELVIGTGREVCVFSPADRPS